MFSVMMLENKRNKIINETDVIGLSTYRVAGLWNPNNKNNCYTGLLLFMIVLRLKRSLSNSSLFKRQLFFDICYLFRLLKMTQRNGLI